MKLKIELVPQTVWFSSVYQFFRRNNRLAEWYKIKNDVYEREGHQCYIVVPERAPFRLMNSGNMMMKSIFKD